MRIFVSIIFLLSLLSATVFAEERTVSSLGRLEPYNGVIHLSGPSGGGQSGAVIKELLVTEGEWVEKEQIIAYLDSYSLRQTEVARLQAILDNAGSEMARQQNLSTSFATSKVNLDAATMELSVAKADLASAQARLELSVVRSPVKAQVLEVHTRPGEQIGAEGVMDLGQTDRMYAVAEVYETDISKVKVGQSAIVKAPALAAPSTGKVERIAVKIGRMDAVGTDPISRTDARVVEVFILLDSSDEVANLTNMQVEVEITL